MCELEIEIHPEARKNFDSKAVLLSKKVTRTQNKKTGDKAKFEKIKDPFEPHIEAVFTEENIILPMRGSLETPDGEIHELTLITENETLKLGRESCDDYSKLAESIWRASRISDYISQKYISGAFMDWCAEKSEKKFTEFLIESIRESVSEKRIIIPLNNIKIRQNIEFTSMNCNVRPISSDEIDGWFEDFQNEKESTDVRRLVQGQCVVDMTILAEPQHAINIANKKARRVSDYLAFYSYGPIIPTAKFNGMPVGQEYTPSFKALLFIPEAPCPAINRGLLKSLDPPIYDLSDENIQNMKDNGLATLIELFENRADKSQFSVKMRDSFSIYFKSAFTSDNSEKLAFIMISLETLFLKNESEPITQNISDRIAIFVGKGVEERKSHAKTIKDAYAMRSKYFHHGQSASDLATLKKFYILAFIVMTSILKNFRRFKTTDELLTIIDDSKYGP